MEDPYVTIRTYLMPHEGFVTKAALEAAGVDCQFKDEKTIQVDNALSPALGGVKLQVRSSMIEKAKEVIERSDTEEIDIGDAWMIDSVDDEIVEESLGQMGLKTKDSWAILVGVVFLIFLAIYLSQYK